MNGSLDYYGVDHLEELAAEWNYELMKISEMYLLRILIAIMVCAIPIYQKFKSKIKIRVYERFGFG